MYGSSRQYAEQYRQVGVTSAVADADPHKLVAMLLAGALERVRRALASLERGDQAGKGKAIGEVCAIVGHLNGSLDHEAAWRDRLQPVGTVRLRAAAPDRSQPAQRPRRAG